MKSIKIDRIWQKLNHKSRETRLMIALGMAIFIALLLTVVSVELYSLDGSSKLDLSRPGYERERKQLVLTDQQKVFDPTGPINKGTIDEFLKAYDGNAKELNGFGDFRDQALDDSDLQLSGQVPNEGL